MKIDFEAKKLEITKIAQKYNLRFVILYGSYAKNQARPDSDIDLAVLGNKLVDFQQIVDLNNDFIDLFKFDEIDVKSLHKTNPLFRYQVVKYGVLLFGDEHDYNQFKAYAFRDYIDSEDLFKLRDIMTNKRLNGLLPNTA